MRKMNCSPRWLSRALALVALSIVVGAHAVLAAADPVFTRMLPGNGPVRVVIVCSSASGFDIPFPKPSALPDVWRPTRPFTPSAYAVPRFGPSVSPLAPQMQATFSPELDIFPSGGFYRSEAPLPQLPRGGCRPVLVVSR
jgi:hypothetical protein